MLLRQDRFKRTENEAGSTTRELCHFDQVTQHPASVASSVKCGGSHHLQHCEDTVCGNCTVNLNMVLKYKEVFSNRDLGPMLPAVPVAQGRAAGPRGPLLAGVSILVTNYL